MITFAVEGFPGTFDSGFFEFDSKSEEAVSIAAAMQEDLDYRKRLLSGYMPGDWKLAHDILREWLADISKDDGPPALPEGAIA